MNGNEMTNHELQMHLQHVEKVMKEQSKTIGDYHTELISAQIKDKEKDQMIAALSEQVEELQHEKAVRESAQKEQQG